ncbi:MAG: hypothetical protein M0042_03055 [Nitrospiraceae bacterium]|nr:hypothetical protein [Nitrospiraceae bacterium]
MDPIVDLETKPLARAIISYAVKSIDPGTEPGSAEIPKTHLDWLQAGVIRTASGITDTAMLIMGRSTISSSSALPEDAPLIIGFSLLIMLGITQALSKEGISLDANALTEQLIAQHLAQSIKAAGNDASAKQHILEIYRLATQVPGHIVEVAKGEVEGLFRKCYVALPAYVQGTEEARKQLMPVFGTALLLLLQSQIKTDD